MILTQDSNMNLTGFLLNIYISTYSVHFLKFHLKQAMYVSCKSKFTGYWYDFGLRIYTLIFIWNLPFAVILSKGLGYHEDLQTRAVFMEVLTKILQQVRNIFERN